MLLHIEIIFSQKVQGRSLLLSIKNARHTFYNQPDQVYN